MNARLLFVDIVKGEDSFYVPSNMRKYYYPLLYLVLPGVH